MLTQQEVKNKLNKLGFKLISLQKENRRKVIVTCRCGNIFTTRYSHLINRHTKSCGCLQRKNLINKIFGRWTVIGKTKNKYNHLTWICKCDCGKTKNLPTHSLLSGISKSCGCLRKEIVTGEKSKQWTGYKTLSGRIWCFIKSSAINRKIKFNITKKYIYDLFIKQKQKCILSGVNISFDKPKTASLDRINSKLGYIKDNVQWVHKEINIMKQSILNDEFIKWCKLVAKYRRKDDKNI